MTRIILQQAEEREVKTFSNSEFGNIRVVTDDENEPWFVAKDVCDALELSNVTVALQRLDDDERAKFNLGRQGDTNVVNEAGLYTLILGSKKKEAHAFKRWVTHEVLPAIRRDGGYMVARDESPEQTMARAVLIAQSTIERQKSRIAELEPKAMFADAVSASNTTILVGDLAKLLRQNGYETGQKRLFGWLRENGYLIKQKGLSWNMPTQRSADMGLFEVKERSRIHPDGHVSLEKTPVVTGKGQVYFINKLCGKKLA